MDLAASIDQGVKRATDEHISHTGASNLDASISALEVLCVILAGSSNLDTLCSSRSTGGDFACPDDRGHQLIDFDVI